MPLTTHVLVPAMKSSAAIAALVLCALAMDRDVDAVGVPPQTWAPGPPLLVSRSSSTQQVLPNGHLYVVGRNAGSGPTVYSAESFDPATDTWTVRNTPPQVSGLGLHLLPNGSYLRLHTCDTGAEFYDPVTDTWSAAPAMTTGEGARFSASLPGGRVLVLQTEGSCSSSGALTAEVFDPATSAWSAVPTPAGWDVESMLFVQSATLSDGRIYLLSPADSHIFDGTTNTWTTAATRPLPGWYAIAPLPGNRVMVAGGVNDFQFISLKDTYIYDAATDTWADGPPMIRARSIFCLTPMADGRVFAIASDTEVFDPATNTWSQTGGLVGDGQRFASELPDGRLLAFGTCSVVSSSASVQIFDTDTDGDGYNDWEEDTISEDPNTHCPIMRADLNHDRAINSGDQLRLGQSYFLNPYRPRVDQDGNLTINSGDQLRMAWVFGKSVLTCE